MCYGAADASYCPGPHTQALTSVLAGGDADTHAVHTLALYPVHMHFAGPGIVGEVSVVLYCPSPIMVPATTR